MQDRGFMEAIVNHKPTRKSLEIIYYYYSNFVRFERSEPLSISVRTVTPIRHLSAHYWSLHPPPVIFRRKSAMTRRRHHLSPFSAPIDPTSSARGGAGAARRAVRTCLERERSPGHVSSRPVSATPLFTVAGLGGQEFQP